MTIFKLINFENNKLKNKMLKTNKRQRISFILTFSILLLFNQIKNTFQLKQISKPKTFLQSYAETSSNCATATYSKSDCESECESDLGNYEQILKYNSFSSYINNQDYNSNGLNYYTSLFVDSDYHNFANFLNDGAGMIILIIISIIILIVWIPIICCWKKRCCFFDECLIEDECCKVFWHITTYILAAAVLSFIIVCICFGE